VPTSLGLKNIPRKKKAAEAIEKLRKTQVYM
jgi:hypothetical protein